MKSVRVLCKKWQVSTFEDAHNSLSSGVAMPLSRACEVSMQVKNRKVSDGTDLSKMG
jgi:hypothetical protein